MCYFVRQMDGKRDKENYDLLITVGAFGYVLKQ